ncbi:serine/threonine-protein phosphatase, partial [Streptomyces sp. SID7499]|nr:serine/threonine-protein phosphatase [Streptomyces sp. SID7499]
MSQRRAEPRTRWALVAIPIAWIVAVSVIDILAPPDIH